MGKNEGSLVKLLTVVVVGREVGLSSLDVCGWGILRARLLPSPTAEPSQPGFQAL